MRLVDIQDTCETLLQVAFNSTARRLLTRTRLAEVTLVWNVMWVIENVNLKKVNLLEPSLWST